MFRTEIPSADHITMLSECGVSNEGTFLVPLTYMKPLPFKLYSPTSLVSALILLRRVCVSTDTVDMTHFVKCAVAICNCTLVILMFR